ncbi:MAG: MBL fold metallo-hydrolase [Acidimicrobiales bacterium]
MTGPGTNTYLVGEDLVAVVDPGPLNEKHLALIQASAPGRIGYVLATHVHPDHSRGAASLASRCGATLCGYSAGRDFAPDLELRDGDSLELGPVRLTSLHTPGHASDHLCYLMEKVHLESGGAARSLLFSGDNVIGGSTAVISPPDGNMSQYMASLERLLSLDPPVDAIAPGHGPVLPDPRGEIEALLAHRRARKRSVAVALQQRGKARVDDLVRQVYADVDPRLHELARQSLWAHLRELAEERAAHCANPDDIEAVWTTQRS